MGPSKAGTSPASLSGTSLAVHCFKEQEPSPVTHPRLKGGKGNSGQLAAAPRKRIMASEVYGIRRPWAEGSAVVHT